MWKFLSKTLHLLVLESRQTACDTVQHALCVNCKALMLRGSQEDKTCLLSDQAMSMSFFANNVSSSVMKPVWNHV